MTARLGALAWTTFVWVALWGELSVANLAGGVVVGAVLLLAFPVPADRGGWGRFRPLALARLLLVLAWRLVKANLVVARATVSPVHELCESVVAVPIAGVSDTLVTFVANTISLTPGSLVLDIGVDHAGQPAVLYVHVLGRREMETVAVRRDVQRLEAAVVRALGNPDAVAALERPGPGGGSGPVGSGP
jgi:multicomponent Na+:H+ antiporter subunit E